MKETKKLTVARMLAVASAEFFGGGAFNIINFLYPGFLVLSVGLPAYHAGLVILIARIFDAVIDLPIGFLSDKLRARFRTRRKTLLVSAPLILLSLFAMFFPYADESLMLRFFAALFSYILFCAVQSSVMIPYYSLASEITDDYTERARMTTIRMVFSISASIICVALPGIIVDMFEGGSGYIAMSLIFGSVFMVMVAITGFFAREGIPAPDKEESFRFKDFVKPMQLKSFRQYLCAFVCCQVSMAIMSALFFFYVDFYFCRDLTAQGETNMVGLIGAAIMFGMQIFALPVYMKLIRRTGKAFTYIIGAGIWIVSALCLFMLPAGANPVFLYLLAAVMGFGISGPGLIPHAMLPDVIDAGALKFGSRTAGIFSGAANLVIQISQAAGVSVAMALIGFAGFTEQELSESAIIVNSQPLSAQNTIITIMALTPLIFMTLGIITAARYKLNKEKHAEVIAALNSGDDEKEAVLKAL